MFIGRVAKASSDFEQIWKCFERRLIEAYISENSKDPITNEDLTVDDLIDVKVARVVRPRPPTLTSIPSLLSVFQKEWDTLTLESFCARQELIQVKEELSMALYQHDAAVRVIARLTKEREEARDALSKMTITSGSEIASSGDTGDSMQVDGVELPKNLADKVDETKKKLSQSRRKRPIPEDWVNAEDIEDFTLLSTSKVLNRGARAIALDESGELAIVGGSVSNASIYSLKDDNLVTTLSLGGGAVTDFVWFGVYTVVSTNVGTVKLFTDGEEAAGCRSHAGSVTALAIHPSGEILASVGVDQNFVFYDLANFRALYQGHTECSLTAAAFHPDGHLLAAGGTDGHVRMYHVKNGEDAADFSCGGPIRVISFSENGTWFSTAFIESNYVSTFDLRKSGEEAEVKTIDIGSTVESIKWDYTGQFLATAGPGGVTVQQYLKASKTWSELKRSAVPAAAIAWGKNGRRLVSVDRPGVIKVLGPK